MLKKLQSRLRLRKIFGGFSQCLASCIALFLYVGITASAREPEPRVRVSAWYWLNSAPKAAWEGDFVTMKHLGFTDIILCWGLDISGMVTRKADTQQALQWADKAGIGVYLLIWHPNAHSLPRRPEFMQVNAAGNQLVSFDVFNPQWRATQWKSYLQDVAKTYAHEPAVSGYAFDDSFAGAENNISYGAYEEKVFGAPLPRKPTDPRWDEWMKAREGWWEDWAKDTVKYIREIDPNAEHEIYLEDGISSITNPRSLANTGADFAKVAKHFDAVGGYTTPRWTSAPDSDQKVLQETIKAIETVRKMVGPEKKMIYTFWSANIAEEFNPGPAVYPSAAQIQKVCEEALKHGIRHLDMYGFRIGNSAATGKEMERMMPAEPAPYVLTGQFPQKFMWDRPEIQTELGKYLRSLNQK